MLAVSASPEPRHTVPARAWRVLLVDDDPEAGERLRAGLEGRGIRVSRHRDGMAALAEFRQYPEYWDGLITAHHLPGMRGPDLVREVTALRPAMACIIRTACAHHADQAPPLPPDPAAWVPESAAVDSLIAALGGRLACGLAAVPVPAEPSADDFPAHLADLLPAGVFATDAGGLCVYANAAFSAMVGQPPAALVGRRGWLDAFHPDNMPSLGLEWAAAVRAAVPFYGAFRYRRQNGDESWAHAHVVPHIGGEGKARGFVGVVTDASECRGPQMRMEYLAHHDPLTGLPNRLLARDRLLQAISFAGRSHSSRVALMVVDVDRFKQVNETFGHSVGDAVLTAIARRLEGCVRGSDTVGRLGGDEFLLLLSDLHSPDSVAVAAAKILQQFAAPLIVGDRDLISSVSIGIAVHPDDGSDFDTLLRKADTALYQAKAAGRNTSRFYAEEMNAQTGRQIELRSQLRLALERNEFILRYQPIVAVADGRVVGAEALIRWRHPARGLIPPDDFIPVAEDSGMIVPIGEWTLREACREAARWRRAGLPPLSVAVNLSAVQFSRGDLGGSVAAALGESGLDPALLDLEITESILIHDNESLRATLRRIAGAGTTFSLDDFGTGYASFAYLKRFEIQKLKIDRSFVSDLRHDVGNAAIVGAVVSMAHALGLHVVAEGVEDEETVECLRGYGCEMAQGYHFARPLPPDDFMAMVANPAGWFPP